MVVHSIGTSDCDNRDLSLANFTQIVNSGPIYQYGSDGLWHKYETDSNGAFGEITTPQAGAPPF